GLTVNAQTLFRYQYSNHLGSAGLELDKNSEIVSYEEFHPYGTSAYRVVRSGIEVPPKRYRFASAERDAESGLSYHGKRYYTPAISRWISADPIGIGGGPNVFCYCHNDPVQRIDPSGTADLGTNAEQLRLQQQDAANAARAKTDLSPVRVVTQRPIDPTTGRMLSAREEGSVVPDEVRLANSLGDQGSVLQVKARNLNVEANQSASQMAADIVNAIEQTSGDVNAANSAGLVRSDAKGQVLLMIADSRYADPEVAKAFA